MPNSNLWIIENISDNYISIQWFISDQNVNIHMQLCNVNNKDIKTITISSQSSLKKAE